MSGVRKSRIKNEPKLPKLRKGDPPDYLDALGIEKWNELYPLLSKAGVLRATDVSILAVCCDAYSVWRRFRDELAKTECLITETPSGAVQQAPIVAAERNSKLAYMRALAEICATPSSLSRLNAAPEEDSALAELNEFINAGKQPDNAKGTGS